VIIWCRQAWLVNPVRIVNIVWLNFLADNWIGFKSTSWFVGKIMHRFFNRCFFFDRKFYWFLSAYSSTTVRLRLRLHECQIRSLAPGLSGKSDIANLEESFFPPFFLQSGIGLWGDLCTDKSNVTVVSTFSHSAQTYGPWSQYTTHLHLHAQICWAKWGPR